MCLPRNAGNTTDVKSHVFPVLLIFIRRRIGIFRFTNIDEAEDKAALIENNIRTVFEEPNVFIGISSRSIRTITADRLIAEAEEALNHANSDPDARIVGFHVDIEKYRELVEK